MKLKHFLIFLGLASIIFILWKLGLQVFWAKFVLSGVNTITTSLSSMQKAVLNTGKLPEFIYYYSDRSNKQDLEHLLPTVVLIAWQITLFFVKDVDWKYIARLAAINILIVWLLQILYPLMLFNINQSKFKLAMVVIGLQLFDFMILFLIIKDIVLLRFKIKTFQMSQLNTN